jgi:medium-chain acyl-[acyl-carrier-protein] hydrolase
VPYRESFRVRSYEVDPRNRLSARALCGYLQEVASVHAAQLGASMARLGELGLGWVLHRLKVEIARQARLRDTLDVSTWPTRFDRVLAERDFVVSLENEVVAVATSRWAMADLTARRPVRMPDFVLAIAGEEGPATVAMGRAALPEITDPGLTRTFHVRRSDLDVVQHVTNTQLVSWVAETVPAALEETHRLAALEVVFQREALLGDVVASEAQALDDPRGPAFAHRLRHAGDGRELVRAVTAWARD